PTDICSIGNLVWTDANNNGQVDRVEAGIPAVRVELWRDADGDPSNGAEQRMGWTYTDTQGYYVFNGQVPGVYQLVIPVSNFQNGGALAGATSSSLVAVNADNQADEDNNGLQPDGPLSEVRSPLITLAVGAEPAGNGLTGVESGRGGDIDDVLGDASGEMTVDFGFTVTGSFGIGNLVFEDFNGNSVADADEGVDGVRVQLFAAGQSSDTFPLAERTTADGGKYLFVGLPAGSYYVHLPASEFGNTGILRGLYALPGSIVNGDDNVGQNGIENATPETRGISTGTIILASAAQPTNAIETGIGGEDDDVYEDDNIDMTVDLGFYRKVGIGNLVFFDVNGDGHASANEGVANVTLQLYLEGAVAEQDSPFTTTQSDANGLYLFDGLRSGSYFVHIPSSMFQPGAPLYTKVSVADGLNGDDDVGDDGLNTTIPSTEGVSSNIIDLYPGQAPTDENGETGVNHTADNAIDAAEDLTIDFGFQTPAGVGNLVFRDTNGNGHADTGEGVSGVRVEIYNSTDTPGFTPPLLSTYTNSTGHYLFDHMNSGDYVVHIPAVNFANGQPLAGLLSMVDVGVPTTSDDDVGENGIDSPSPAYTGTSSNIIHLEPGTAPTAATGETGYLASEDNGVDANVDLTVDFGFSNSSSGVVGVGNTVFQDKNGNLHFDEGEGVDGVTLQLFPSTVTNFLTTTPLRTTISTNGGDYYFGGLQPGNYVVFIPPSNFTGSGKLKNMLSLPGQGGDNGLDDDQNENGDDPANPASTGVKSTIFNLGIGQEPIDESTETGKNTYVDGGADANSDLTIDFGFYQPVGVGNMVFADANGNGKADMGEGVGGVTVELYIAGALPDYDLPKATMVTSSTAGSQGKFMFTNLIPGNYFLRVPGSMFTTGHALVNKMSMVASPAGDDNTGENGVDDSEPDIRGINTPIFSLTPGSLPFGTGVTSGELGLYGTDDDGINGLVDKNVDLTQDFGFADRVGVGNLVFRDNNGNGKYDAGVDVGVDGVAVELYSQVEGGSPTFVSSTLTSNGGRYLFHAAPGTYIVYVSPANFQTGGPLEHSSSSVVTSGSGTQSLFQDDDKDEDGVDEELPELYGVRSFPVTLLLAQQPTSTTGETGVDKTSDDAEDTNTNLTIDFGFTPDPLCVGNLVFRDVNQNGKFDSGDQGIAGVKLQLYAVGAIPGTTTPVSETISDNRGSYELFTRTPGSYFIVIPASEFASGKPLASHTPAPGFGQDNGVDDSVNEDTLNAPNPDVTGINSIQFVLAYGQAPLSGTGGTETGFQSTTHLGRDQDSNMTIDLGFRGTPGAAATVGVGNVVFVDQNGNGHFDASEGVDGVWVLLYSGSNGPANASPVASTFTSNGGRYIFTGLQPGTYTAHIAADNFKQSISINNGPVGNGPLYNKLSMTGNGAATSNNDDNLDEDGIDALNPEFVGISSPPVNLQVGTAPVDAGKEKGTGANMDDGNDGNVNLTMDFGFVPRMGAGNLVFKDVNTNGRYDPGIDQPVDGVPLMLFNASSNPTSGTPVATTTTSGGGLYSFVCPPGAYYVFVPTSAFTASGALANLKPTVCPAANVNGDDDVGENTEDAYNPTAEGARSGIFTLTAGQAPVALETGIHGTDDDASGNDANVDLTIDLGFAPKTLTVGNLVFKDVNGNSKYDASDTGVAGVKVQLFPVGTNPQAANVTPVAAATTAANGTYTLTTTVPGDYFVYVAASEFSVGGPLFGSVSSTGAGTSGAVDDNLDENGIDAVFPAATGISSTPFTLAYNAMPLTVSAETGAQGTMDDLDDSNGNLTIDFGFTQGVGVGNLVFFDANGDGKFSVSDGDVGIGGVTVELFRSGDSPASSSPVATAVSSGATGS
ncbi:MAG: hypothetical protein JWO89_3836, partial [Verrucomicrobiaceae bacterium]|nr:hypothetical protein [Verrucomicrobiaceae bacterium]